MRQFVVLVSLVVALVSRLMMSIADAVWAALTTADLWRRRRRDRWSPGRLDLVRIAPSSTVASMKAELSASIAEVAALIRARTRDHMAEDLLSLCRHQ